MFQQISEYHAPRWPDPDGGLLAYRRLSETVSTPFYEIKYDFVLQKAAQALAAAE